jgi:hypothetical protein
VCQCWWRICREIMFFFPGSNITCFTFYIHLWPVYWLSFLHYSECPRKWWQSLNHDASSTFPNGAHNVSTKPKQTKWSITTSQSLFRSEVGKIVMDIGFMINYVFIELLADELSDKEFAWSDRRKQLDLTWYLGQLLFNLYLPWHFIYYIYGR